MQDLYDKYCDSVAMPGKKSTLVSINLNILLFVQ